MVLKETLTKKRSQIFNLHTYNLILATRKYLMHIPENASTLLLNNNAYV